MRVIAGTARSLPLKTLDGIETRPTTDRIKETLFNMIQGGIAGCRFLDLFAGSGAIGIEALSRGAEEAFFVEKSRAACECIRKNLDFTKLAPRGCVIEADVFQALQRLEGQKPFDYIFLDPPYHMGIEREVLEALQGRSFLNFDTVIIIEASLHTPFDYLESAGYQLIKRKEYKTNVHMFVEAKKEN